jgi:hypothetical protein
MSSPSPGVWPWFFIGCGWMVATAPRFLQLPKFPAENAGKPQLRR